MDRRWFDVRAACALMPVVMRSGEGKTSRWRSRGFRAVLYQALALMAVAAVAGFVLANALENMRVRGIQSGFGFLATPAGFDIGESLIAYSAFDPYWKAFAAGVFNTLRVALLGLLFTTLLGTALGVGRFSRNALIRGLCYGYVELFRNVPILLQLLMWYLLLTQGLPDFFDPLVVGELFYLSKAGLSLPVPVWAWGHSMALAGAVLGAGLSVYWRRRAIERFDRSGERPAV
ncbi:MAG TPA: ABC transporter permease subunit, partial [Burkholderiaceae bacterium]|nr:ABC transporter permease subunit [Burkholderiaceae bacterium]